MPLSKTTLVLTAVCSMLLFGQCSIPKKLIKSVFIDEVKYEIEGGNVVFSLNIKNNHPSLIMERVTVNCTIHWGQDNLHKEELKYDIDLKPNTSQWIIDTIAGLRIRNKERIVGMWTIKND